MKKPISKTKYKGEWPFKSNSVILKLRNGNCCIVNIDGKDYALNGVAKAMHNLENVHDAGVAITGKTTSDFIRMAFDLKQ